MIAPVLPAYYPTLVQNVNATPLLTPAERTQQQDQVGPLSLRSSAGLNEPTGLLGANTLLGANAVNDPNATGGLLSQLRTQTLDNPNSLDPNSLNEQSTRFDTGLLNQAGPLDSFNTTLNLTPSLSTPLDNLSVPFSATGLNGSLGNTLQSNELGAGFVSSQIGQYDAIGSNDTPSIRRGLLDVLA